MSYKNADLRERSNAILWGIFHAGHMAAKPLIRK